MIVVWWCNTGRIDKGRVRCSNHALFCSTCKRPLVLFPTKALIFGGIGYGYVPMNDVWRFTMSTETWELLEVVEDSNKKEKSDNPNDYEEPTVPPGRWMHTASSVEGKTGTELYVFGGCSSAFAPLDDLWKFEGTFGSSCCCFFGSLYCVFLSPTFSSSIFLLLFLAVKTKKWENLLGNKRVIRPEGRWLHSASVLPIDEEKYIFAIVIFGGSVNNQPMVRKNSACFLFVHLGN